MFRVHAMTTEGSTDRTAETIEGLANIMADLREDTSVICYEICQLRKPRGGAAKWVLLASGMMTAEGRELEEQVKGRLL